MAEKIIQENYETIMGQSYVDYAMSVITDRAIADVRDGLKPVQRRILHTLNDLAKPDRPHRKCARIVGDTMGKYHPHGDKSIYEGLVNLAQPWKMPIPLVDGHGNFGSVSGDGAAAMRYTEAKMTKYIDDVCMSDTKFFTDQYVPNFDETEKEPTVLPFQVPNLLVSGTTGIAVGMAPQIPSHNISEVIDSFVAYLKDPDIPLEDLMEFMPGPDFATGGIINASKEDLLDIYATGTGSLRVRGKVEVRDLSHGRKSICVTELPYTMIGQTSKYLETVATLSRNHEIEGVVDIADRGDKNGECLAIDVKRGMSDEDIQNIINILYKKAKLEDVYGVRMLYLNKGTPEVGGLKRIYELYAAFKKSVYQTKYTKLLTQAENTYEIKAGLIKAVDCIDLIIEIMRGAKKQSDAKECLITGDTSKIKFRNSQSEQDAKSLKFTEIQATSIIEMRLGQLCGLELNKLKKEAKEAKELIDQYSVLLHSEDALRDQMILDMNKLKELYQKPRLTIIKNCGEVTIREMQEEVSDVALLLDRFYYLKVVSANIYDKNEEQIQKEYRYSLKCKSNERIAVFSDDNQVHIIKVSDVIKQQSKKNTSAKKTSIGGKLSDKGIQIFEFCKMDGTENILYMNSVEQMLGYNLLIAHKSGFVKQVSASIYDITRKSMTASKADDCVSFVKMCCPGEFIIAQTQNGYFIKVPIEDIPEKGKTAAGVKIINLQEGDTITHYWMGTSSDCIHIEGKEYPVSRFKTLKRGTRGVKCRL